MAECVKNPRGATLSPPSPLLSPSLFSCAWKRRRTGYLRLPVPREHVNTITPRCVTLESPPSPTRLSSTRPPFFPFLASPGGPFTAAARFAQVAFEVGSRPKAGWSRWKIDPRLLPQPPPLPGTVDAPQPRYFRAFSFLLRSLLIVASSFLYGGAYRDTNTKRTLGFNWLLSLRIYMYLYMYIYVCIYYMYDLRESARLYCLRVTNECRANNAYLSGENRGWKYNRKSAHPRSPDELTVPQ